MATTVGPASAQSRSTWKRVVDRESTYTALTFILFAVAWQVYGTFWGGLLVPTFTQTVTAFGQLVFTAEFWQAVWLSNQALFIGFGCAVVLGVPTGLVLGRFRLLERFTDVYINIMLVTPMAAIIPLLIMSVGFGLLSRVLLVTLFAIVMVIVSVRAGVRQVDPSLIQMARVFGAGEAQIWRRVLIPASLPAIMTGIRLGLGRAIIGMVVVELLMVAIGFGGLILSYRSVFNGPYLYATIAAIIIQALILISLARWLERRIAPWAPASMRKALR